MEEKSALLQSRAALLVLLLYSPNELLLAAFMICHLTGSGAVTTTTIVLRLCIAQTLHGCDGRAPFPRQSSLDCDFNPLNSPFIARTHATTHTEHTLRITAHIHTLQYMT